MAALLLAVILVLGYHYESHHPTRRLKLVRQVGYKLYFNAGYSGFSLALQSLAPSLLMVYVCALVNGVEANRLYSDKNASQFFIVTLSIWIMLFSALITKLRLRSAMRKFSGVIVPNYGIESSESVNAEAKNALYDAVMRAANDFERYIILAAKEVIPLRVVLPNGKVYIGWAQQPDLEGGELTHVKLLPILSGYLDDKQQMHISRNYFKHYSDCYDEDGELLDHDDNPSGHDHITRFAIIIKVEDVQLISFFSKDAFDAIEKEERE